MAGEGDMPRNERMLKQYENYYEKVVRYFPKMVDAHELLGFSYYYLGKEEKAVDSYEKAFCVG